MKNVIKVMVCIVFFAIALIGFSMLFNRGNTDMTALLQPARYPVLNMIIGDHSINSLKAYTTERDIPSMRESITPLVEGRGLSIALNTYGCEVSSIVYEIRDLSGERLVEQTELDYLTVQGDVITSTFSIKNLIEENMEYNLIFCVTLLDGTMLKYYTRIIQAYDYKALEKLNFAFDFSKKTFLRDETTEDIVLYLESNDEGDNSTYQTVDIHSSFQQITWDNLDITRVTEPVAFLTELSAQTASIQLKYLVSVQDNKEKIMYSVIEKFRIRYGSERIYLLDYKRTMDRLFHKAEDTVFGDTIMLGIVDEDTKLTESTDGNQIAFVSNGTLYSYNCITQAFTKIYCYYDEDNFDERTLNDQHDIEILSIDETGDVKFLVYGYMNRGKHEGEVGVNYISFSGLFNVTEEILFIPYNKTYSILKANIDKLVYLSKKNELYLYLDGTIYEINPDTREQEIIAQGVTEDMFKTSADHMMLTWQAEKDCCDSKKMYWMNMNTKERGEVLAGTGNRIRPLGFMGEDMIYGIASETDLKSDELGQPRFPMYALQIRDSKGKILKTYEENGIYIVDCIINENMLSMRRVMRSEDAIHFEDTSSDTILNNQAPESGQCTQETVITQNQKRIVQLKFKKTSDAKSVKGFFTKDVLYEGSRVLTLENGGETTSNFYVYDQGEVAGIYSSPAKAVCKADEISGVVISEYGECVWKKGNRLVKNQIMAITAEKESEAAGSLSICLDAMLSFRGVTRSTQQLVASGSTPENILKTSMPDCRVFDLTGCTLEEVLYYPNVEVPVLAMLEDGGYVLIIGYNELNTVVMDPEEGSVHKIGMNDSKELFERGDNRFVTYLPIP